MKIFLLVSSSITPCRGRYLTVIKKAYFYRNKMSCFCPFKPQMTENSLKCNRTPLIIFFLILQSLVIWHFSFKLKCSRLIIEYQWGSSFFNFAITGYLTFFIQTRMLSFNYWISMRIILSPEMMQIKVWRLAIQDWMKNCIKFH